MYVSENLSQLSCYKKKNVSGEKKSLVNLSVAKGYYVQCISAYVHKSVQSSPKK